MKKRLLVLICSIWLAVSYTSAQMISSIRVDTSYNGMCKVSFSSKLKWILKDIENIKQSRFISDNMSYSHALRRTSIQLAKSLKNQIFTKIPVITGVFFEKEDFTDEDYISIQEWIFNSEHDVDYAYEQLKRLKKEEIEDFTFLPHWILIRSGNVIYLIDSTFSTNNSIVTEVEEILKKWVKIEEKLYFN